MAVESSWSGLAEALGSGLRRNVALAPYTSMRVGGAADLLVVAENAAELTRAVVLARQYEAPCRVLGGGCNVLIADAGVPGLVIVNRAAGISFAEEVVQVESGAKLAVVAQEAVDAGLAGLTWAVGLPGTVGGGVVGNAGAFGGDMAGTLRNALVLEPDGEVRQRPAAWFDFRYRGSRLKGTAGVEGESRAEGRSGDAGGEASGYVVLEVALELQAGDAEALRARADEIMGRRRTSHPCGATMGSTFKNPPGGHAGRLIEQAGLKGYRIGGAKISEQHGNFFINLGDATAGDVRRLIEHAQTEVERQFGVALELEIELLGWDGTR